MSTSAIDESEFLREQRAARDRVRERERLEDQQRRADAFFARSEALRQPVRKTEPMEFDFSI